MKTLLLFIVLIATLLATDTVPHDRAYYTKKVRNTELIYTKENQKFAKQAAAVERDLQPEYEDSYGYVMDEILHVGLISDYNQIANGFSTQFPNNRQINYIGGAAMVDYFSSTSWLNTLLYHETAHNYQVNAKDNLISSSLHSILGNGGFIMPLFTIPNILESSFLLEGNAVLNESWHGNGGRLYSGRFKAATLMQAKEGYLTPERLYNENYFFLYGSHFYTLGGFYQEYLAKNYGLKKVNSYWKEHSQDWFWPFFTNNSMERAIGADFETTLSAWNKEMQKEAALVVEPKGEVIASSQFFEPLNSDSEAIYFMINESGRAFPQMVVYDKQRSEVKKTIKSWIPGKVIKTDGTYTTQASSKTSPWRIYMGLYDKNALILEETEGRVVEGYLSDGRMVYFDIKSSFDQPQLFIGEHFYAQVNSSVFIDNDDNLYYFVQKDKTRTLYKNKEALFSIRGYYSYVSGIDSKGAIYFIANTQHGTGLFRFLDGRFTRASQADTIFDARLIDDTHALVAAMGSDAYLYEKITLEEIDEAPYEVVLFVENQPYYRTSQPSYEEATTSIDLKDPYYSFLSMNYSATNIFMGSDEEAGFIYNFSIDFADPLNQNALSLFALRNLDEYTLIGGGYTNSQYFLHYSVSAYAVADHPDDEAYNDYGMIATVTLPFIDTGRYHAALNGSYYQDYTSHSREPLSLELSMSRFEQYGVSWYPNSYLNLTPYCSTDREDIAYGGSAHFEHQLGGEFYLELHGQYSNSDAIQITEEHGIKISSTPSLLDGDPTAVVMPSIKDDFYVKSAAKGGISLKKVFNLSAYYFTFPISLRREAFEAGYTYYDLEPFRANQHTKINEASATLTLDTLILHTIPLPLSFSYLYNDVNNEDIANQHTFRLSLGFNF